MKRFVSALVFFVLTGVAGGAAVPDVEEQTRKIASELRCPVCQNLSVGDSPSELAQQMRSLIGEQLKEGKSPDEVKAFFVAKYGDWVLLAPEAKGFSLLLWILPYAVALAGIILVILVARRWVRRKETAEPKALDPALVSRVRQEVQHGAPATVDSGDTPEALLQQEQGRIYGYIRDLEFDYHAGKISEADYQDLRRDYELQAVSVLKSIESLPKSKARDAGQRRPAKQRQVAPDQVMGKWRRGWVLAFGGAFILIFGVTIGVLLSTSLKTRQSQDDSITGDFLTGTGPAGISPSTGGAGANPAAGDFSSLLAQGKSAFERNDLPQAIEAFKRALAINPDHPEPHAFMGLILSQAGHYDGALMAFDKALSANPNLALALWGKGMLLFHVKKDLAGARNNLEKVLGLMPPGPEREEVQKTLLEINLPGSASNPVAMQNVGGGAASISGSVSVDNNFKTKVDGGAALFLIARSARSSGGPPLAVKKIERPEFPVSYTLGQENVMMPGVSFSGKIVVSARLDKDGNAATRQAGDLFGEYKNNPIEVGAQKVDIVIDKAM